MYTLKFTKDAIEDIRRLPKNVRNSLKKEFRAKLAVDPSACSIGFSEPLQGWRSFHWGRYRVVFKVYDDLRAIAVVGVGQRRPGYESDVYRKLEILARKGKLAERILRTLRVFSTAA